MRYLQFILKKLLAMAGIMFAVSFIVFFLLRMSGTDPVTVMIGTKQATPELVASLRKQFYLDEPLFGQYLRWLGGVVTGDFGVDYINKQDIAMLIAARIPVTVGIVLLSSVMGMTLAVILGVTSALNRNKALDKIISTAMLFLSSAPSFVVSILVIVAISKWVPGYTFIGSYGNFGEYMQRITIPSMVMSLHLVAMLGRVTRSSMITQLQAPYVATATAKGMSGANVTYRHAFHNAVLPVLTIAGMMFASSVGGTVLIEQIFSLPGIGGMLVEAIQMGNYPVVQILVLFMLVVYLMMSFAVEALYGVIDPRVKKKA